MKHDTLPALLAILASALVGGLIFGLWLIGAETVKLLAFLLIGGLVLAGVTASAALPIRAWKKRDGMPIERQVIREVRILDMRPAPVPQLPAPTQPPFGVFPELLRASYQAGALNNRPGEVVDGEVQQMPADGWDGEIS